MGYGIKLLVWGDYACFTRPEMKGERVSYDVITPTAARGILEAIYWKPAIRWRIDAITVLNPIRFDSIRRNELGSKIPPGNITKAINGTALDLHQVITQDRQQRATMMLRDVRYLIEAHFEEVAEQKGESDTPEKHYNMFLRRARNGQCFHRPYLGCREFPAFFRLIEAEEALPESCYAHEDERDLGWMLKDIVYEKQAGKRDSWEITPLFFRAIMKRGTVRMEEVTTP